MDLAFTFSPLVERTAADTVVLDLEGCELLFGAQFSSSKPLGNTRSARNIAKAITQHAVEMGLNVNVAIAANPDAAIHAGRNIAGMTVVSSGGELAHLGGLPLKALDYSLAGIDSACAGEIRETLGLWGVRTFSDFARLPLAGIAQRLGQEGVRLQKLAQGKSIRQLFFVQPPIGFGQSIELEHPIAELEPLSFILARLLNQLCANLNAHALATNELRLELSLENKTQHKRTITLPVPMRNARTFLRLLLLDIELHPPPGPIFSVAIAVEPVKLRVLQNGLFIPLAPEPEKLEVTLARLTKLLGPENVGSPELLDTHRPDAFRMRRFALKNNRKNQRGVKEERHNPQSEIGNWQYCLGFRVFRPPLRAEVRTINGQPTRISAQEKHSSRNVRGDVVCASGPWRTSGDWWRIDAWARDEWDVAVDLQLEKRGRDCESFDRNDASRGFYRIYYDLHSEAWFVEGMYD